MWKSSKNPETTLAENVGLDFASGLNPAHDSYAVTVVDRILKAAVAANVTDIHFELNRDQTLLLWRIDGTLIDLGSVPNGRSTSILNRIKALARLVTYRTDIPQEGRLIVPEYQLEARVGTLPTLHGERAVIRLASGRRKLRALHELGLPAATLELTLQAVHSASGVILICGPAGSGKTTTAYACLRELANDDTTSRSLVTLEDPIEIELPGVAQSQINPAAGYDWASGLKALLRQDPEVMLVGEIRDAATAAVVFDAAVTGQLVISTMHARSAADAVRRLQDMGIPTQQLLSGLNLLTCQRLLRSACACQHTASQPTDLRACPTCGGSGYNGRFLLSEVLPKVEKDLARALMADANSKQIESIAASSGMLPLLQQATEACDAGQTTTAELKRHFTQ
ncbi:MAG: ATPase, T2SS/T4P/T4SS family [Pirellulaceae bacterium]|nr:ATPase, T2SS/T4P/T4SS family [Pirellulaceae bacterium]